MNEKIKNILNNLDNVTIEELNYILNNYISSDHLENGQVPLKPILDNGIFSNGIYNPFIAATLNQKYKDLTGTSHPSFLIEQPKVLDLLLTHKKELLKNGYPITLINNLENLKNGLNIINDLNHPIFHLKEIINNLDKVSVQQLDEILKNYKGTTNLGDTFVDLEPILVNGTIYQSKYNPFIAATLNQKYKDLTGTSHPSFLIEQRKVLDFLLNNSNKLPSSPSFLTELKKLKENLDNNNLEINTKLANKTLDEILSNLDNASLEEVDYELNHFNKTSITNGIIHHHFNDPFVGNKLNNRYFTLTGQNHPYFTKEVIKVIDDLLANEEYLISIGAYSSYYFEELEKLKYSLLASDEIKR